MDERQAFEAELYGEAMQRRILGELCWYLKQAAACGAFLDAETVEQMDGAGSELVGMVAFASADELEGIDKAAIPPQDGAQRIPGARG